MEMVNQKVRIFNIQKYNIYDGPGVRTLIFFQGCPLRCQWCSNPEGMEQRYRVMYKEDACRHCGACAAVCPAGIHLMQDGRHALNRQRDCLGCRRCVEVCPEAAVTIAGMEKSIEELMEIIEEDRIFYGFSGGGVTLGGGEVLMQPEGAAALLAACKQVNLHTAIETCGYAPKEAVRQVARYTDLFLFDLKHMDSKRHLALTGVPNEIILHNLTMLLEEGHQVKIRMPLLKGVNDQAEELARIIAFLMPYKEKSNFQGIDLLPYHKLGVNKYQQLGREYPVAGDPSLAEEDLERISGWLAQYDVAARVIRH